MQHFTSFHFTFTIFSILVQADPVPPPEPDPRPPPPPPDPPGPAPAAGIVPGPRLFVVRRGVPNPLLRPQLPQQLGPPLPRAPQPAPQQPLFVAPPNPAGQQNLDILQELLRQQVLRLQQDVRAPFQHLGPAAAGAPPPPAVGDNLPPDALAGLPQVPAPAPQLNALQTWQLQWQQQQ